MKGVIIDRPLFRGPVPDCGSGLVYLQATVDFGRRHPAVGAAFTNYLINQELL